MTRDQDYAPFLDWLKCIGMLLILYGHFAEYGPAGLVPPIHLKQIGVGCFLFAAGYSLSRETRDRWQVVYNRLFEVYLFGIVCAVVVTAAWYPVDGGLRLSNYEPFVLGVNVILDEFPANPSTWYLGTYVHIVVLWALFLYRRRVPWVVVAVSAAAEIVIRATLMREAGLFIAYMAFTNWMTVFLLGCWYATGTGLPRQTTGARGWAAMGVLLAGVALWLRATKTFGLDNSFPFMQWPGSSVMGTLVVSAMVSGLYVGMTWLIFVSVRGWPAVSPMRFVARHTLIIFLGHMPLMYALRPGVSELTGSPAMRSLIYVAASLLGLGYVSEGLRRLMRPRELRNRLYAWVTSGAHTARSAGTP